MDEAITKCHVEWHYAGIDFFFIFLFIMLNPSVEFEHAIDAAISDL